MLVDEVCPAVPAVAAVAATATDPGRPALAVPGVPSLLAGGDRLANEHTAATADCSRPHRPLIARAAMQHRLEKNFGRLYLARLEIFRPTKPKLRCQRHFTCFSSMSLFYHLAAASFYLSDHRPAQVAGSGGFHRRLALS